MFGMGGYAFSYADGDGPNATPTGMSHATLAPSEPCISGSVMALPPTPTPADLANDWGCGIGFNLNQAEGAGTTAMPYAFSGTGVTVTTTGVPPCTVARVVVDLAGTDYCAAFTEGTAIPWTTFNTACWDNSGTALTGPPTSQSIKVQFLTSAAGACPYTNFCVTGITAL
jgi:hypothetical protein